MKQILALGGSNSRQSINKQFAAYAASQVPDALVNLIDLNDYEMPIFSVDRERSTGHPEQVYQFRAQIDAAHGIIVSLAEYNGSYAAAFKNIIEWTSRIERCMWMNKPLLLAAVSTGGRGAQLVLRSAAEYFPRLGARLSGVFSLPNFYSNFTAEGIVDATLRAAFEAEMARFIAEVHTSQDLAGQTMITR